MNFSQHANRLDAVEENQKILGVAIASLKTSLDSTNTSLEKTKRL